MNNFSRYIRSINAFYFLIATLTVTGVHAKTINISELSFIPTVDGLDSEWRDVKSTTIPLSKTVPNGKSDVDSVTVKFGVSGDNICFLFHWSDSTHNRQHKPFIWNDEQGKYVTGPQREDRLAIQFAMDGDYDTNWMSGKNFAADTWHWKSARTNPIGVAQDKMTVISKHRMKRAYKGEAEDGATIYIKRPSDSGDKLYRTKRYSVREQQIMPKYIMSQNPQGSIADVKAKGLWSNGAWNLEGCRKLDTGNVDDVVFSKGSVIKGGISIFNQSGDADHNHSEIVTFKY